MPISYLNVVPALVILGGGVWFWIPSVVRLYGDKTVERRWLGLPFGAAALALLAPAIAPAAWSFLSLIIVALLGVVACDRRYHLIPDRFQIAGAAGVLGVMTIGLGLRASELLAHGAAGIAIAAGLWAVSALYARFRGQEALGFGDVKLLAWLGLAFGPATVYVLGYGTAAAALLMLPGVLMKRRALDAAFAFGPFLIVGALLRWIEAGPW